MLAQKVLLCVLLAPRLRDWALLTRKQHTEVPGAALVAAGSPPPFHCLKKNRSIPYSRSALRFGLLIEVDIPFVLFTGNGHAALGLAESV